MSAYPNSSTSDESGYETQDEGARDGARQKPDEQRGPLPRQPDKPHDDHTHKEHAHGECVPVPEFKRLNYFYGQMLGAADFQTEQAYFREKMKLHNRCLHGYGVICGLGVAPEPIEHPCAPEGDARIERLREELQKLEEKLKEARQAGDEDVAKGVAARIEEIKRELERVRTEECEDEPATRVRVECGLAIDCEGNELVVRRPLSIDLWRELGRADRDKIKSDWKDEHDHKEHDNKEEKDATGNDVPGKYGTGDEKNGGGKNGGAKRTLYLSICFCEQPTDPVRPVMADACGVGAGCNYGKTRDSFKIRVSAVAPEADERCATCCEPCTDQCLLLARIENFRPGQPLAATDIHNEVRRPISLYVPTTITGISWSDGAEYTESETESLLGMTSTDDTNQPRGHLLVRFSRPVHVSTIKRGVFDVWVTQGGGGRHSDIFNLDVEYVDLPAAGMTDRVRFRAVSDESPNPGDRIMFIVRGSRILDACCRPVDAANTGGRTPFVVDDEFKEFRRESPVPECQFPPPFGYGPWTSGTNAAGADHVSWIYVKQNPRYGQKS